ncbi:MAG TPA: hypothetical protein VL049_16440 [Candidatus Dormibacteraeota bacterium]|nr:hypothetical protein [Candidatus Dormibacteraeota bacterium]
MTRFDAATGRVDRFVPYEEVLDQSLRSDDFMLRALLDPNA